MTTATFERSFVFYQSFHDMIALIPDMETQMDNKRNITPKDKKGEHGERAFREFKYIWLALDWLSPYSCLLYTSRTFYNIFDKSCIIATLSFPVYKLVRICKIGRAHV